MEIGQFLDATYLKTSEQANLSEEENLQQVINLTKEAILYDYKLIMIRSNYISFVKKTISNKETNLLIGTVIGFHEGINSVSEKLKEAQKAIDLGADELDFVLNYEAFKKGNLSLIDQEILACTKLCLENKKVVKWIIETAALTTEEIIVISQRIKTIVITNFCEENAKYVFVKSSTGFYKTANNSPNGATLENMQLIVANAKPLKVKAAGGVRDFEMAIKMIALGVDRIGTSSSKAIVTRVSNFNKNSAY